MTTQEKELTLELATTALAKLKSDQKYKSYSMKSFIVSQEEDSKVELKMKTLELIIKSCS